MKKTYILTFDATNLPDWHARAISTQMAGWLKSNKTIFPNENLIILPASGDTKLYWLDGEDNQDDIKNLEQVRDRIKPVLEVALNIKIDKEHKYAAPKQYSDRRAPGRMPLKLGL